MGCAAVLNGRTSGWTAPAELVPERAPEAGGSRLWALGSRLRREEQEDLLDAEGFLPFTLHGERLRGAFALLRTHFGGSRSRKPQWLLVKRPDAHARRGSDVVAEELTSVASGRTMEEIGKS